MSSPTINLTGNLTADLELRFTPNGRAVARARVACNTRRQDGNGEWVDGDTTYLDVELWGRLAENAAESVKRGDRVLVVGRVRTDTWEQDGETKSRTSVAADEFAVSLQWATAVITRNTRQVAA